MRVSAIDAPRRNRARRPPFPRADARSYSSSDSSTFSRCGTGPPVLSAIVVETGGRPVIVGGDVAVWFGEFDEPPTEGRQRVLALDPELVWLTHEREPWRPPTV